MVAPGPSTSGQRIPRTCRYRLLDEFTYGFEVDDWDGRHPLTIDPGLVLASYVGGNGIDVLNDVETTALGIFVCGATSSTDFPTSPGAFQGGLNHPHMGPELQKHVTSTI